MADRRLLRTRIIERLDQLDDAALLQLDMLLAKAEMGMWPARADDEEPRLLTRRQLVAGLLGGGAVLSGTNLATAWYAWQQGEAVGRLMGANAAQAEMVAEASRTRREMEAEIEALRGLVKHYEALERTDLDEAVARSIEQLNASIADLQGATQKLVDGIATVRGALARFEAALPALRQGMAYAESMLEAVDQRLDGVREVVSDAVERAEPIADRLGTFFDALLEHIPFGIGERIDLVVQRIRQVFEIVPEAVAAVREHLIDPLQSTWFAETADGNVQAGLLTPIRARVLEPAEQLLASLDQVAAVWDQEMAAPLRQALAERRALRQALAEYRQRHRGALNYHEAQQLQTSKR